MFFQVVFFLIVFIKLPSTSFFFNDFLLENYNAGWRTRMYINHDNGYIGFGLNNPDYRFHIKGDTAQDAILFLEPSEWDSTGDYGQIMFGDGNHYIRGEYGNVWGIALVSTLVLISITS